MAQAPPVIAIFGPTGVGKTEVALALGELLAEDGRRCVAVSADAMQVYRGLETLTGAPTVDQQARLEHRLVSFLAPSQNFSAGEYARMAHREIDQLRSEGAVPLVVGGTGLYLRGALAQLDFLPPSDPQVRMRIDALVAERGYAAALDRMAELAPRVAARYSPNEGRRLQRALELLEGGIAPERLLAARERGSAQLWSAATRVPTAAFCLTMERGELYRRIDSRAERMVAGGAAEEVRRALAGGVSQTASKALGFQELLAEDVNAMKRHSRHYARRQLTWSRKLASFQPVEASSRPAVRVAAQIRASVQGL